jgi:hypothetical protein
VKRYRCPIQGSGRVADLVPSFAAGDAPVDDAVITVPAVILSHDEYGL